MTAIKQFFILHTWALVADLGGIAAFFLAYCFFRVNLPWFLSLVFVIIGVYLLILGLKVHGSSSLKKRSLVLLLEKNKSSFREDSFKPYMGAPCGRLLVRGVLAELSESSVYSQLKKKYSRGFFSVPASPGPKFVLKAADQECKDT